MSTSWGPQSGMARVAVVVVAACPVLLLAACVGGAAGLQVAQLSPTATPGSASSGLPAAPAHETGAVAFAGCMRSEGLSRFPDPDSSGAFDKTRITAQQLGVSDSQLQDAQRSCQHLLPTTSATQQHQDAAQALQFSQCVRNHGVSTFPDPDSTGRIPDPESLGIDQGSPQFQAANQACARYRPPYIPSNEQYDSYAAGRTASTGL
jgi:hypothetical protein